MSDALIQSSKKILDPMDRISELLFGLIMALTVIGSVSVVSDGRTDVGAMLVAAFGCNLAWGIIDAVFYLMGSLAEKDRGLMTLLAVREATEPRHAQRLIADALPSVVASVLEPSELEAVHQRLKQMPAPPKHARLRKDDWLGAAGVFLVMFTSMFPLGIPFIFMDDAVSALRVSNSIAIVMLFLTGYAAGRLNGRNPWAVGISMVFIGAVLVSIAIALGG